MTRATVLALVLCFSLLPLPAAETAKQDNRWVVELADGSRLVGQPKMDALPLVSSFGKMSVRLDTIASVAVNAASNSVTVNLRNGDRISGSLGVNELGLDTAFGQLKLPAGVIKRLTAGGKTVLPPELAKSLVLHYTFDADDGDKVVDQSGKENDGKVKGSKWEASGHKGGAMRFADCMDYVACNSRSLQFNSDSRFTVMAWVYIDSEKDWVSKEHMAIVSCSGSVGQGTGHFGYFLVLGHPADRQTMMAAFYTGSYCVANNPSAESPIELRKWFHLAGVCDGGVIQCYVNGELKSTVQSTLGPLTGHESFVTTMGNNMGDFSRRGFNGVLDDVMILNRALSSEELLAIVDGSR